MSTEELKHITKVTLAHYEGSAEVFWQGTKDHDVSQNIAALLQHIEVPAPFNLLDFGCGPGRDLQTFKSLGHHPVGLEGAAALAAMARQFSNCEVWEQNFIEMDLPKARFDGIFANAVLFHVPSAALPKVLRQLFETLRPGGVLFCSNPRGEGQEGWNGTRYGGYHDLETWRRYMAQAGFAELAHYYRPTGLPIEQQPWLATVWRRPSS